MNKSYLKWAGGKSRILTHVIDAIGDCRFKTLIEPFVGSATVALNVDACTYILNDSNQRLIDTHKQVAVNFHEILGHCEFMFEIGVSGYEGIRKAFNNGNDKPYVLMAAMFIYLNKHGFNGMYRENQSGGFNIPVNKDATPSLPIAEMKDFNLSPDCFTVGDFEAPINNAQSGNIVYCDPPYPSDNISDTDFTYTKDGFSRDDHLRLRDAVVAASKRGVRVIVSYCDIKYIRDIYDSADEFREVLANRSISSKSSTRGKAKELLIIFNGEE